MDDALRKLAQSVRVIRSLHRGAGGRDVIPVGDPRREENLAAFQKGNHPDVPHVVFHGTKIKNIDQFHGQPNWFAEEPYKAGIYARGLKPNHGDSIYPAHISLRKPLHIHDFDMNDKAEDALPLAKKLGLSPNYVEDMGKNHQFAFEIVNHPHFVEAAMQKGFDGIIANEGGYKTFGTFLPNQIKSSIGNSGNFDPNDPDIRKADGGDVDGITAYHGSPHDPDITKSGGGDVEGYGEKGKTSEFDPDQKYNGHIPHIKYLPTHAIEHSGMAGEVHRVSEDVARNMDYSEPVETTAFRYGPNHDEHAPSVMLGNGHHRLAAAKQMGVPYLPVTVHALNAKGHKLNALKALSDEIERNLSNPDINKSEGGDVEGYATKGAVMDPLELAKSVKPLAQPMPTAQQQAPSGFFEVAPGKTYDPKQKASWEQLHPQAKQAISNKMIGEFISPWQRATGYTGEVRPGLGGFEGDSNPNYTFHPYNPDHIGPALNSLGHFFRQDSMMGAHSHPFEGSFPAGVVRVHMPADVSPEHAHEVYKNLHAHGLADGHSTDLARGTMDIMAGSGGDDTVEHAKAIDNHLGGQYGVSSYPAHISFPEHGTNYGISGTPTSESSRTPVSEAYNSLRTKAEARLGELLEEAHNQGGGHQGKVSFGDTLAQGQPNPNTVSALMPKTVSAYKGPPKEGEARQDISPEQHSRKNLEASALRMWRNHPASGYDVVDGEEAIKRATDFQTKNLLEIWDRTPPAQRQTSRFWYRAAHALGNAYADEHDIMPRAAHGIMAVLSPQNPWDKNVTQAERLMDILHHHLDTPWTNGMSDVIKNGGSGGKGLPQMKGTKETGPHKWSDIQGKTLREVLAGPHGEARAAMWSRAFDEAHNPTEYNAVSPTGQFIGTMMNKSGSAPDTSSWNSYLPIQKAISIWHNPSLENINQQIGNNHKVREFYNVIANPHDPNGVVIDTHAVAAGDLLPHGSAAKAVHRNFGTSPGKQGKSYLERVNDPWVKEDSPKKTGSTGAIGDYPIHAESVRKAAWARGVHPSEMQSVTWERVRTLFSDKGPKMQKAARDIWQRYAQGELNHSQAVDEIFKMAGGGDERAASWHGTQQGASGLGDVRPGSYVRPMDITADTPAIQRYGKKPEHESTGGFIRRAYQKGGKVEGSVWNDKDADVNYRGLTHSPIVQHVLDKIGASLPAAILHQGSVTGRRH